jgi:hypothetical protein
VQSPFWSQGLNRYAYVFNSPMNLVDPSGFSAIGDYFQGLNDAPPEQAVPGYIGTGLVAGLAAAAIYEGVSASFAAGTASTVSTAATQSGGLESAGPYARGAGAATVAIQRIKAATEDSVTREPGPVPTRSATRPVGPGRAHATSQPQKVSIFDPKVGAVACGPATQACIRIAQAAQNSAAGRTVQRAIDRYGPQIVNWLRTQGSNIGAAVSRFVSNVGPVARAAPKIPFKGFQEWGRPLWGRNLEGAQKAFETMTPEVAKTIDPTRARQALEFYKQAEATGRGGETAGARIRLMERILELQK